MTIRLYIWVRLASVLLLLSGCAHRYFPGPYVDRPDLAAQYADRLQHLYPRRFQMTQRIILHAGRKDFDFSAALSVDRECGFRAVALGELGVKFLDLVGANRDFEIVKRPERLPPKPILMGVMPDIQHLYMMNRFDHDGLIVRKEEGRTGLVFPAGDGTFDEYVFSDSNGALLTSHRVREDRVVSEIEYGASRRFAKWSAAVPAVIIVRNKRWKYTMEIRLIDISPKASGKESRNSPKR